MKPNHLYIVFILVLGLSSTMYGIQGSQIHIPNSESQQPYLEEQMMSEIEHGSLVFLLLMQIYTMTLIFKKLFIKTNMS